MAKAKSVSFTVASSWSGNACIFCKSHESAVVDCGEFASIASTAQATAAGEQSQPLIANTSRAALSRRSRRADIAASIDRIDPRAREECGKVATNKFTGAQPSRQDALVSSFFQRITLSPALNAAERLPGLRGNSRGDGSTMALLCPQKPNPAARTAAAFLRKSTRSVTPAASSEKMAPLPPAKRKRNSVGKRAARKSCRRRKRC